jgi:hypothetical protein
VDEETRIYRVLEILEPSVCLLKLTFVWSTTEDFKSRKDCLDVCHMDSSLSGATCSE